MAGYDSARSHKTNLLIWVLGWFLPEHHFYMCKAGIELTATSKLLYHFIPLRAVSPRDAL